jgi:hypothetical protein
LRSFYRDYWFHCCQRLRCGAAAAALKSAAAAAEHLLLSCLLLLLLQQNARVDCQQNWNWQQHISLT